MTNGEIISIIAVCLSFIGITISFVFSYKKADREKDKEREDNLVVISEIKNDLTYVKINVKDIKDEVRGINDKMQHDHDKLVEHENKIKNLEKEVFKK